MNDINQNATIKAKVEQFSNTFVTMVVSVLAAHVFILSVYAFAIFDWSPLVKGFDVSQWSVYGRVAILVPYLIVPVAVATAKVAGFSLTKLLGTKLTKTKLGSQADD